MSYQKHAVLQKTRPIHAWTCVIHKYLQVQSGTPKRAFDGEIAITLRATLYGPEPFIKVS